MICCNRWGALALATLIFASACAPPPSADAQDVFGLFTRDERRVPPERQLPREVTREVSADAPLRLLVIGDSLADGFGTFLGRQAEARAVNVAVTNRGRSSTGLARSDFYDWPGQFEGFAQTVQPDVVVAHFGANDMQGIVRTDGIVPENDEGWEDAYRVEIRRILDVAARTGAVLIWLGPGPDRSQNLRRHLARINPLIADEARLVGAKYLPLAPHTAGPDGAYVTSIETADGRSLRIRTGDGSHFTSSGYGLVADLILDELVATVRGVDPAERDQLSVALQ